METNSYQLGISLLRRNVDSFLAQQSEQVWTSDLELIPKTHTTKIMPALVKGTLYISSVVGLSANDNLVEE